MVCTKMYLLAIISFLRHCEGELLKTTFSKVHWNTCHRLQLSYPDVPIIKSSSAAVVQYTSPQRIHSSALSSNNSSAGRTVTPPIRKLIVAAAFIALAVSLTLKNPSLALVVVSVLISSDIYCYTWYHSQPSAASISDLVERLSVTYSCPRSVHNATDQLHRSASFTLDQSCNAKTWLNRFMCYLLHPGANVCYRSVNKPGHDVAVQCCYGDNGLLLIGPPGGGTLDFQDATKSISGHFWADVAPGVTCNLCGATDNSHLYYKKRPSISYKL